MTIYISGKVTGLPEEEYKARFEQAEASFKAEGHEVINPLKLDHTLNNYWADYMLTCIDALPDCDAIYMLSNWKESKGARLELNIAKEMGKQIFYQV
jgi:Asp-tRNA(Asn)/Glu-tRNA(Gln) amidotransferase A subunit family amidase